MTPTRPRRPFLCPSPLKSRSGSSSIPESSAPTDKSARPSTRVSLHSRGQTIPSIPVNSRAEGDGHSEMNMGEAGKAAIVTELQIEDDMAAIEREDAIARKMKHRA